VITPSRSKNTTPGTSCCIPHIRAGSDRDNDRYE
jgi:hypothetical protein